VILRECLKYFVPVRGHRQDDSSFVRLALDSTEQISLFATLTQGDSGMMRYAESSRCVTDGGLHIVRSSGNLQEQLVLLRVKVKFSSRRLTELKKLS
jgi:hypothetical protein